MPYKALLVYDTEQESIIEQVGVGRDKACSQNTVQCPVA